MMLLFVRDFETKTLSLNLFIVVSRPPNNSANSPILNLNETRFDRNYPDYTIEEAVGLELKPKLPDWVRNIFIWYGEDKISEDELIGALQFLIKEGIIKV